MFKVLAALGFMAADLVSTAVTVFSAEPSDSQWLSLAIVAGSVLVSVCGLGSLFRSLADWQVCKAMTIADSPLMHTDAIDDRRASLFATRLQ